MTLINIDIHSQEKGLPVGKSVNQKQLFNFDFTVFFS